MVCRFIASLLFLLSFSVGACTRYVGITLLFNENSAIVVPGQMARLMQWVDEVKVKYPRNNGILVVPGVETTESNALHLARRRELAVRLALIDLDLTTKNLFVEEEIHPAPRGAWGVQRENDVKHVIIQYLPDSREFDKPCIIENKN